MSATTPVQVTEKKARKPTLSAKYSKFMVFGYNFVQSLRASDILNDEGLENAYAQLKMFDTVDTQSEFYEQFLSQSGESGRVMRKFIIQRNKPPKAPRKPRAKKAAATTTEPTTTETTTTTTEPAKEKKPANLARRKPRKLSKTHKTMLLVKSLPLQMPILLKISLLKLLNLLLRRRKPANLVLRKRLKRKQLNLLLLLKRNQLNL